LRVYSPSGKFRDETTNHHDYDRKPLPERSAQKQREAYKPSGKFNGETTNHHDYTEKPFQGT
jgi:hypothetical protein